MNELSNPSNTQPGEGVRKKPPQTFSPIAVMFCATLAFALGWSTPWALERLKAAPQDTAQTARTEPDMLKRFNAIDWKQRQQPEVMKELIAALPSNTALRAAALERYRKEPAGAAKDNLGQLLTAQPLPEVSTAATAWAQQADSATARADGFNLLMRLPPQPQTFTLARQAIEQETDPAALAAAVWAIQPLGNILDPAEVQRVVPRLHALTQHPLADVRSASIQRLAQWDRADLHTAQDVLRLLSDPVEDVRIAAIGASSIASLKSDKIKEKFFEMLVDPKETNELQSIVMLQIDRFGLSAKEYGTYQEVERKFTKLDDPANPPK